MKLPTWLEANRNVANKTANPIDVFIDNNEPAGLESEEKFREELEAMLEYVRLNWQGIHIRFSIFQGSHIFVFGRYLSNGFWWIPKQDAGYRIIKGCVLVYRFAITWHGLYGK